jgi:glycine cleavage system T protein (aminomethyltransferase)
MTLIRATPFHGRAAAANRRNLWRTREGWTLAASYGDPVAEALAPRLTVAMADITWRARTLVEGARAEEFLTRLLTRDPTKLAPGEAFKALWLADRAGLRGAGALVRMGRTSFLLVSASADDDWIARGASLFDVKTRKVAEEEGGLAIIGPYAAQVTEAAGLDAQSAALTLKKTFWRGLDVTVSRLGEHGGYEIWCNADDAHIVWDRVLHAGKPFAIRPIGLDAIDLLDLEAGVPRPGRDYTPARGGFAAEPSPVDLGLQSLVDADHATFNGRAAYLALPRTRTRVGIDLDGEVPAPRAALSLGGRMVGKTLGSAYSPALRRAIALAVVDSAAAAPGTVLRLGDGEVRVGALPFLK